VRSTELKTVMSLPEGQTLVLVKNVPNDGTFDGKSVNDLTEPRSLVVFVTPSLFKGQFTDRIRTIIKRADGTNSGGGFGSFGGSTEAQTP